MEVNQKTKYRIGMAASVILICIAGVFDLLSLIPLVGTVMGTIFWVGFGAFCWTRDVSLWGGKKMALTAISYVAEIIPVVQELPMLVAGIIGVLLVIRIEDKTGMSLVKPMKAGVTPPRYTRVPKNKDGVRKPE